MVWPRTRGLPYARIFFVYDSISNHCPLDFSPNNLSPLFVKLASAKAFVDPDDLHLSRRFLANGEVLSYRTNDDQDVADVVHALQPGLRRKV